MKKIPTIVSPSGETLSDMPPEKKRVIVCVPTHEMVPHQFAFDFANMIGYTLAAVGDQLDIVTNVVAGTYVHKARQQLVDEAIDIGCNWLLWVDSDMRFPKDALIRLMAHKEEMVGINYASRGVPTRFIAIERTRINHLEDGLGGKLLETWPESTGLEEVEALGFGMVLMQAQILTRLPENEPWFWFGRSDSGETHVGEDVWFCTMARKAGVKIYVDHDLSKDCAHCGTLEYKLEHAQAMAEMAEEEGLNVDYDVLGATDGDSQLDEPERSDESDS